jgi:nitrogen fixation protein FixH
VAAGIFAGFAVLLTVTVVVARRAHEGLVERDYYESATREFAGREEEVRVGFRVTLPDRYRAGGSRFTTLLETADGPLRGARVTLAAMRPSGTGEDGSFELREESPGRYAADILLPRPGQWMLSLAVDAGPFRARRRWTAVALPEDPAAETPHPSGTFRSAAGTQEVILSISPWPPRAMRELSFAVELPGYSGASPPHADLSMPGMEMGRNRVRMARGRDGIYRGTGVFVRCASGRKEWEAAVSVPDRGKAVFRIELAD